MTVWRALGGRGYLGSAWPWRATAFLVSGALLGAVVLVVLVSGAVVGGALAVVLLGLPLLVLTALTGIPVAAVERRRLRLAGVDRVPAGQHRVPGRPGLASWLTTRLREAATWRELAYAVLLGLVLWPLDALAVLAAVGLPLSMAAAPVLVAADGEAKVVKLFVVDSAPAACAVAALGLALLAAGAYVLGAVAGVRAELARALLGAKDGDSERVTELVRSRARLVDAFEAERRRIERDLHDGAQQRLVALTMTLGLARLDAPPGPLADQLAKAHGQAGQALAELRELIHGIHPKVLADYGLRAALADAADRSPVPVDLELDLPGRLPGPVETAAYFAVCEALANVARHSGASRAGVRGGHADGRLVLQVRDDGRGGADPEGGSGLTGLADRVSVLDGTLSLSSPPGGPTLLRVEIPCRPTDPNAPCA
ncbi:histidine kinase [Streptomyces cyaneogriseus subsp. noncyanogenus]|uniref:histidine kinase n=1 Tax=Streptomyces cyaneogriseus subsp. noncyanogenus TaxID=477245 RepID=A0A0C5FQX8_9ACTN|nr:sensor histidine kinase [Streptomyces cyaneogriseus]AJP02417.1 histidine kinase [Streptomyces cyaneogriseus subsp. noncyanogenus]